MILLITIFLPLIAGDEPVKAGYAPSSHVNLDSRVYQLDVGWLRGWKTLDETVPRELGGVTYVPNLRPDQLWIIDDLGSDYSGRLLLLNEPDMCRYGLAVECDATPLEAAQLYLDVAEQLPHARLISPGVSHVDYLHGWQWTRQWIIYVSELWGQPPEVWAWDTHTYLDAGDPLAIIDSYEAMLAEYGIVEQQFIISEWAACTPARVAKMRQAFDGDKRIVGHAYYDQYKAVWDGPERCTSLFIEGTAVPELSKLGLAYLGILTTAGDRPQWM